MEISADMSTELSQKIVKFLQDFFIYFASKDLTFYAFVLISLSMITFPIIHTCKVWSLAKNCYDDVDNVGFSKVNIMNLLSVIMFSFFTMDLPISLTIFFASFSIPIFIWFLFMLKLFILNVKRYTTKKNFVKKIKKQAQIKKQIGIEHRISIDNVGGLGLIVNPPLNKTEDTQIENHDVCSPRICKSELIKRKD